MGEKIPAKKKGIGALNWTLLLVIGFSAQIAWVIENNWFANFLYSDFGAQLGVVTAMTICSATATTFSALFFGTLSDRIGSRKKLITWGSVLWGVFTIAFGMTHYLRDSIYNNVMLIGVTIVAADTIMSFFGSMANDAGYNAWYADMMDDSNSGQIGAVAATLPVIGTLVGTLVGGMFVNSEYLTRTNPQGGYIAFFTIAGAVTILVGIASFFLLKDDPKLKPVKDGSFWHQFGSTFNFKRFVANKELALVFLTLCIFFIGYNCYFIHIMNWMNYTLGFNDPSLILGIPLVIAVLISIPFVGIINNKKVPFVAFLATTLSILGCLFVFFVVGNMADSFTRVRREYRRKLAVLCRHYPRRHRLCHLHAVDDRVDEAPVPRGAPRSVRGHPHHVLRVLPDDRRPAACRPHLPCVRRKGVSGRHRRQPQVRHRPRGAGFGL
ncbi:MAG: MFS transporter [Christensenellales bacterium]